MQHEYVGGRFLRGTEGVRDAAGDEDKAAVARHRQHSVQFELRLAVEHPERLDPVRMGVRRGTLAAGGDAALVE